MKGVVFTQFIELVEDKFGFDVVDQMIEKAALEHNGIYTQAGYYPAEELFSLVKALSEITQLEQNELVYIYGEHLFPILVSIYPNKDDLHHNSFDFIANVDNIVHPEVQKLYPDSELPEFTTVSMDDTQLKVRYRSTKPLMDFARGLMVGCIKYFKEDIEVEQGEAECVEGMYNVLFTLKKQ
jgi:hypothetical protein